MRFRVACGSRAPLPARADRAQARLPREIRHERLARRPQAPGHTSLMSAARRSARSCDRSSAPTYAARVEVDLRPRDLYDRETRAPGVSTVNPRAEGGESRRVQEVIESLLEAAPRDPDESASINELERGVPFAPLSVDRERTIQAHPQCPPSTPSLLAPRGTPRRVGGARACRHAPRGRPGSAPPRTRAPRARRRAAPTASSRSRLGAVASRPSPIRTSGSRPRYTSSAKNSYSCSGSSSRSSGSGDSDRRQAREPDHRRPATRQREQARGSSRREHRRAVSVTSSSVIASIALPDLEHVAVENAARRHPARTIPRRDHHLQRATAG